MPRFQGRNIPKKRYRNYKLRMVDKFDFKVRVSDMKLQDIVIEQEDTKR